jgi:hypothetical protein
MNRGGEYGDVVQAPRIRRIVVALVACGVVLTACGDDATGSAPTTTIVVPTAAPSTTAAPTTVTVSTTTIRAPTTTGAPTTGVAPTTTGAAPTSCVAPASHALSGGVVVVPPASSTLMCAAGWRMFGWIGESGDGILLIQRVSGAQWATAHYGPGCGGVASAPVEELVRIGVPRALAERWGGGCG